jgi:hypothetical protein
MMNQALQSWPARRRCQIPISKTSSIKSVLIDLAGRQPVISRDLDRIKCGWS